MCSPAGQHSPWPRRSPGVISAAAAPHPSGFIRDRMAAPDWPADPTRPPHDEPIEDGLPRRVCREGPPTAGGVARSGWRRIQPGAPSGVGAARPRRLDSQCMTTLEYVLNIALVGVVVLQVRGIKLTAMFGPWV